MTFVCAGLVSLYPLAEYLSDYSTAAVQRRNAAENAAVIAALPERYVKNTYDTCDTNLQDLDCTLHPLPACEADALASHCD